MKGFKTERRLTVRCNELIGAKLAFAQPVWVAQASTGQVRFAHSAAFYF